MPSRSTLQWTAAGMLSLALAASAGCGSSDGGVVEPVDSGPEAGPPADGGPPVATADGAPDARDAGADVILPGSRFCAGLARAPRFCDDFDDLDLTNDWDQSTVLAPSAIDLDDSTYASAPVSFVVATKGATSNGSLGNASLRKTVLGNVSHATLAFAARLSATSVTKGVLAIATLDVSSNHYFTLYLRDGDPTSPAPVLEELTASTQKRHRLTRLPPAGQWTKIVIDVDLSTGKANVTFDGLKALEDAPIDATPGTEGTVRVGAVYVYPPSDPFTANFDDVVLDF